MATAVERVCRSQLLFRTEARASDQEQSSPPLSTWRRRRRGPARTRVGVFEVDVARGRDLGPLFDDAESTAPHRFRPVCACESVSTVCLGGRLRVSGAVQACLTWSSRGFERGVCSFRPPAGWMERFVSETRSVHFTPFCCAVACVARPRWDLEG